MSSARETGDAAANKFHWWFQNLNEGKRKRRHWLNFRGSFGPSWDRQWLKYEVCTGRSCRLEVEDDEGHVQLNLGLLFFTLYLELPWLKTPKAMHDRHYGFYWFEWSLRAHFHGWKHAWNAKDPWYYSFGFNVLDLLFGDTVHFERQRLESNGPRLFEFRGKTYSMDEIKITLGHWFRPRIPMALYCHKVMRMHLEIKAPPMRAGKGENSWDLDDDGSFGMTCPYDGPKPSWDNREAVFEHCCLRYCESAAKDIQRYGRAEGDKESREAFGFKYIGRVPSPNDPKAGTDALG